MMRLAAEERGRNYDDEFVVFSAVIRLSDGLPDILRWGSSRVAGTSLRGVKANKDAAVVEAFCRFLDGKDVVGEALA
jgi:hypothetical protein